jgi:hypothetical protein
MLKQIKAKQIKAGKIKLSIKGRKKLLAIFTILTLISPLFPVNILQAAPPVLDIRFSIAEDGSETFDANDDPGNDSSANNGIVRNLDIIKYKVELSVNEGEAENVVFTSTLSSELSWIELPSACRTSEVTPISSISEDKRTLICNTGKQSEGTALVILPLAKVKGDTPNGTTVSAQITATTDNGNTVSADEITVQTTAVPKVDLRKIYLMESDWLTENHNGVDVEGKILTYAIALVAEKGSEQLDETIPITLTDLISTTSGNSQNTARLYTWGDKSACRPKDVKPRWGRPDFPYGKVEEGMPIWEQSKSVQDSGEITCLQGDDGDDTTFDQIDISIENADLSGNHTPTRASNNTVISSDDNFLASYVIDIWVPRDDLIKPENLSGSTYQMTVTNTVADFDPISITGQSNYGANREDESNNSGDVTITGTGGGSSGYTAWFGSTLRLDKPSNDEGYSGVNIGEVYTFANDEVLISARLTVDNNEDVLGLVGEEMISCLKIDLNKAEFSRAPSALNGEFWDEYLKERTSAMGKTIKEDYEEYYAEDGLFCSGDEVAEPAISNCPEFLTLLNPMTSWKPEYNDLAGLIEYSTTPLDNNGGDQRTATCGDSDGPWYTDVNDIPGGLSQATRARIAFPYPDDEELFDYMSSYFYQYAKLKDTLSTGDRVGFFQSISVDSGATWEHSEAPVDDTEANYALDYTYDFRNATRVTITSAQVRTHRYASQSQINAGDIVDFRIESDLVAPLLNTTTSATIVDTLPEGLDYIENTYNHSALDGLQTITGPVITTGSNNETILTWTIDNIQVGEALPTITYQTRADVRLTNETFATKTVIDSPLDTDSEELVRTSQATIYLQENGSFNVMKVAIDPENPVVEIDRPVEFSLTYANSSDAVDLSGEQFIEVLPHNGDNREISSNYHGTLEFSSITGSYGETFEYTNHNITNINLDPCHQSNVANSLTTTSICSEVVDDNGDPSAGTGAVNWLDCSGGFNTGTCPITEAEVTGIRISAPALPIGSNRQFLRLTLNANGNQEGDLYSNNFGGRAAEISLPVISNDLTIGVVMSTLGDLVWFDTNGDGVLDVGEPGIPNVDLEITWAGPDNDLSTSADNQTFQTTTDADGRYTFPHLYSGEYQVRVDDNSLPLALLPTYDLDGIATAHQAEGTLGINQEMMTFDFGYQSDASLGDFVWLDENYNGIQDAGESGIEGVVINAIWAGPDNDLNTLADNLIFSTTSASNGAYLLENIPHGNYDLELANLDEYSFVPQHQGGDTNLDSDINPNTNRTGQITLTANENKTDIDFGLGSIFDPPSVDKVVNDAGLPELEWRMVWINGGNVLPVMTEVYDDIPAGTTYSPNSLVCEARGGSTTTTCQYNATENRVEWTGSIDADYGATNEEEANNEVVISFRTDIGDENEVENQAEGYYDDNNNGVVSSEVILSNDPTTNEALDPTRWANNSASIGNTIWYDQNNNGEQDKDEPGIENIRVKLIWYGPDGDYDDGEG